MTTTELIKLLKDFEFCASGRPREITLSAYYGADEFGHVEIRKACDGDGEELFLDLT